MQSLYRIFSLLIMAGLTTGNIDAQNLAGAWEGTLTLPNGTLRIVFNVSANADGSLSATMDSPDQGATGIPTSSTEFDSAAGKLIIKIDAIKGAYEGTLDEATYTLNGTWSQGGGSLPLNLEKTEKPTKADRPQTPKRPLPYKEIEITVANTSENVELAGTLTLPDTAGPHPAVVLVTGSGPQDRDETIFDHKPFFVLSDYLTRQGIAVLRYDDRGTAKSTGDFSKATTENLASDAQAAVDYLKSHVQIQSDKVGVIGHSEGGIIAAGLAAKPNNLAFIVMLAGPGLPGHEILRLQTKLIAKAGGMPDDQVKDIVYINTSLYDVAMSSPSSQIDKALAAKIAELQTELGAAKLAALGLEDVQADAIIKQLTSPWFQYFLRHDPKSALEKVQIPVLSLIGDKDLQVPATENTEAIKSALNKAGNSVSETHILPGLNHLFQTAKTGNVDEYGQITETIAPSVLKRVGTWILNQ